MFSRVIKIDDIIAVSVILGGVVFLVFREMSLGILSSGLFMGISLLIKFSARRKSLVLDSNADFADVEARDISSFTSFVCELAGVDPLPLKQYFPYEISKYFALGMTIVFTGILAAVSGGYAIYKIFDNIYASLLVGVLWGALVANIDRVMVMSISKYHSLLGQFIRAIPRILLAIIIALVISKPIEVRFFENRLRADLTKMKSLIDSTNINKATSTFRVDETSRSRSIALQEVNDIRQQQPDIPALLSDELALQQGEYNRISRDVRFIRSELLKLRGADSLGRQQYSKVQNEIADYQERLGREEIRLGKINDRILQIQTEVKDIISAFRIDNEKKLTEASRRLDYYEKEKFRIDSLLSGEIGTIKANSAALFSKGTFMLELLLLEDLKREDKSIFWVSLAISLLMIAVETMPIFAKLLAPAGSYDYYQKFLTDRVKAEAKRRIEESWQPRPDEEEE
ncbi:MAG: DUF4407 domain-containing protein [Bacteroidota bacterium]